MQEWIEGQTLEAIAEQGALSEPQVVSILTSLLSVLDFIHTQGIVHRDIKPDNVILRAQTQQPVLIDFGAMRETMGTVFNSRHHPTSSIVIGTPGYMPSEQAAGRPIPSSDLYSLGLMAIYLLTGKTPQDLPSDPQSGEIIWRDLAVGINPALVEVIDRAVRSHPKDRYSSAAEMLSAISNSGSPAATIVSASPASNPAPDTVRTVAVAGVSPVYVHSVNNCERVCPSQLSVNTVSQLHKKSPFLRRDFLERRFSICKIYSSFVLP